MNNKNIKILFVLLLLICTSACSNKNSKEKEVKKIKKEVYKIGDIVTYKGMDFYVIEDSDSSKDYLVLLKDIPLTVDEVDKYGKGHINKYISYDHYPDGTPYVPGTAFDVGRLENADDYGGMAYYTSETCRYENNHFIEDGCKTDYNESDVKYVVDGWSNDKLKQSDLKVDSMGYKTRLITKEDLVNNLGYTFPKDEYDLVDNEKNTPDFVHEYNTLTMSQCEFSPNTVWYVGINGLWHDLEEGNDLRWLLSVRPVINLLKSAIK